MSLKKIGCVQLVALMFIPLGLSMDCSNTIDTRTWYAVGVCTEISARTSNSCKWDIIDKSNNWISTRANGLVSESPTSVNDTHVLWNCSVRFQMPLPSGDYSYNVLFGKSPSSTRNAFILKIEDPGKPILKECPAEANIGDSIKCECTTSNKGKPPPILSWKGHAQSATLRLADITQAHNKTYTCEMIWGTRTQTASFTLLVRGSDEHDKNDKNDEDKSENKTPFPAEIVGVAGAAVFFAIATTVIAIVTIRRKRAVSKRNASDTGGNEDQLIENRCYSSFPVDGGREYGGRPDNDYADVSENVRGDEWAPQTDLYAAVQEVDDMQTSQPADVYAVVEKSKGGQSAPPELYTAVETPKGKQQSKKDKSAPGSGNEKREITVEGEVYAVVDKGDKSVTPSASAPDEEMYARVVKSPN